MFMRVLMEKEGELMSLFKGPMREHLNGQKELTEHKETVVLKPSVVYIPVTAGYDPNPNILVNVGDKVKVGTKIAAFEARFVVPVFASVSGTVIAIEDRMHQSLRKVKHIVIESDGLFEKETGNPTIDWENASREELIEFMKNAGIIGCGGAGFPSYVKYAGAKDVKELIINAVECEPFITSDYKLVEENFEMMLMGVKAMKKMAQAPIAKIAIKKSHPELIELVNKKLQGVEGIVCTPVPDVYPMGWERTLIYEITGQRYDRLPGEVGVVLNNATTAYMFAKAMTTGEGIVARTLTVSGDGVKNPVNVTAPVGTLLKELVAAAGGYTAENILLSCGGPMMGGTVTTDEVSVERQSNAITVQINKPVKEVACLRCGRCSDHCPAGLQPVRIANVAKTKNMEALGKLEVMKCIECGMCTYICPSKIAVTENVRRAKRAYMASTKK